MRNLQAGLVDVLLAVEQEVEVDGPRPARRAVAGPPELRLELEQQAEERAGTQRGLDRRCPVQEAGLVADGTDRLGLPERRDGHDFDLGTRTQPLERNA